MRQVLLIAFLLQCTYSFAQPRVSVYAGYQIDSRYRGDGGPATTSVQTTSALLHSATNIALDSLVKNNDIEVVMIGVAVRSLFGVPETYTDEDLQKSPYYQDSFLGLTKTIASLEKAGKKVIFLVKMCNIFILENGFIFGEKNG